MKSACLSVVAVTFFVVAAPRAGAQSPAKDTKEENKKDGITYNMDYLEKTWGIKFKNAAFQSGRPSAYLITLEFTKDVENLQAMRDAFKSKMPARLLFYFFDKESVSLGKTPALLIQGELTGKKGDAFRVKVMPLIDHKVPIAKIEARAAEIPSDKEKEKK